MLNSLLTTKTFLPVPQEHLVPRSHLVARLEAGLQQRSRLFLVSAAAGAGKSTLLAAWAAAASTAMAWVSLDKEDNDPIRFWTYVTVSIQQRCPGRCQSVFEALRLAQPPPVMSILPGLVNELAALEDRLIIALDDYHLIEAPAVHESLIYLLDHLPPNIHLAIASRSDPPLPLHRWRARGQLTELRFDDLRFNREETGVFFNEHMQLRLSGEDIQQLERRTEGWAVGLQLAAISLQGRADPTAFIARFSASHHYVLEYLTNEVLQQLPEAAQDFLVQISILPRFCAPLCEAITGRADSAGLLEKFWQANLFLIPLDDDHTWFRFHHLFADLLQIRLKAGGGDLVGQGHRRAAEWFAQNGLPAEAVQHALLSADWDLSAGLITRFGPEYFKRGDMVTLQHWIERIPDAFIRRHGHLCKDYGWVLALTGKIDFAVDYLALAEAALVDDPDNLGDTYTAQAYVGRYQGRTAYVIDRLRRALETIPVENDWLRSIAGMMLGMSEWGQGRLSECDAAMEMAVRSGLRAGGARVITAGLTYQARVKMQALHLDEAERLFRQALQPLGSDTTLPGSEIAHFDLAFLYLEREALDEALAYAQTGVELSRQSGSVDLRTIGLRTLASTYQARGEPESALEAVQQAHQLAHDYHLSPLALSSNAACHVEIALQNGDLAAAQAAAAHMSDTPTSFDPFWASPLLARIDLELALGRKAEALALIADARKWIEQPGRQLSSLKLHLRQALASPSPAEACSALQAALELAYPARLARSFHDLGQPMLDLLEQVRPNLPDEHLRAYVDQLLGIAPPPAQPEQAPVEISAAPAEHSCILSERELEVLRLAAQGLTNAQIAAALIVATSTVKTHLNNIYVKLGARNRADAVMQAKEAQWI